MSTPWIVVLETIAALVSAGYVHGLFRIADAAERRNLIGSRHLLNVPGLLFWILVLFGTLRVGDAIGPGLSDRLGTAILLGMAIGQRLPWPGRRPRSDGDG